jgi:hypothetical protein
MAFRTGISSPHGSATGVAGDGLARRYSWQWPLHFDLGAKVTEAVHVGGYLSLAFGAEGSDRVVERYCDDDDSNLENDIGCTAFQIRVGVQAQYHFRPDQLANPWVGYGIGFESTTLAVDDRARGYQENTSASGITFAKLDGGLDFRLGVGLGPYVEAAVGRFTSSVTRINGERVFDGRVEEQAWHTWITVGVRLVVFP